MIEIFYSYNCQYKFDFCCFEYSIEFRKIVISNFIESIYDFEFNRIEQKYQF